MQSVDVAIIGAGVVGSAVAYYLKKHGFSGSVAVFERDTSFQQGSTGRSVGGLRQQFSTPENIALSLFALRLVRNLKQEFGTEADLSFREQGYLILASEKGLPILSANHEVQMAHGADNALLSAGELARRFPWLNTEGLAAGCLGLSGEGWLDPYSLMALLRKQAMAQGCRLIAQEVKQIETSADHVQALVLADGTRMATGHLVNAAGPQAGAIAAMAGISLPVEPRKRYVYLLDCPSTDDHLKTSPLTVDPSGIYVRPEGQHFLTGLSPAEKEEPDNQNFDVDYDWFESRIWPGLAERIPAFEAVKVLNAWAGHYDYNCLDQNAVIGCHPRLKNFYFANGFSGHGLQQGPAAGNAVAELITYGAFRMIDLKRFGYERLLRDEALLERNVI